MNLFDCFESVPVALRILLIGQFSAGIILATQNALLSSKLYGIIYPCLINKYLQTFPHLNSAFHAELVFISEFVSFVSLCQEIHIQTQLSLAESITEHS